MKSLIPWFCLAATASTNLVFASNGVDAYRQGDYIQAIANFTNNNSKDPIVDYYMGRIRLYGYGLLKNNVSALRYFQQAGEKGFLPAQRLLALYSFLEENNPEQALYWFKKAANANDTSAQMYCAAAYLFGLGVNKNTDVAKRYYIAAAKNGDSVAQTQLAKDFLDSRHEANKKLGILWLNKAVDQKNPEAQLRLGQLYANGKLVELDLVKAKELIGLSVAQGYLPAIYQMGEFFLQQNDFQQAKEWFTKAAMVHYGPAEIALSKLYTQSKSPFYDKHLGFLWMLKAAQNGFSEAQSELSLMYKSGLGVEADENLAKEWQEESIASEKDTPHTAQVKVAQWLSVGKANNLAAAGYRLKGIFSDWHNREALRENTYNGSPQMDVVTREMLFKPQFALTSPNEIPINEYYDVIASTLDSASQHQELGLPRYSIGDESEPSTASHLSKVGNNDVKAQELGAKLTYLQGRAVLGDSTAQFTLGQMYQQGIGTTKDVQQAIHFYELASAQQDLRAEYNLGLLYLEGQDIPADYQKAATILRDAAFKGNDYAQYALARIDELGYRNAAGEVVIPPNLEQATVMYDLAAANDYGLAKYRLAELLVREKNPKLTVAAKQARNKMIKELYQGAAVAGIEQAALPLAFFNAMDTNKKKQATAFEVAKKEANAENPAAALLLGLLYDRGIGTSVDQSEALNWYQKAPLNTVTEFILGTYFIQGVQLGKNIEKGTQLLQQSADAGFSYAKFNGAILKQQQGAPYLPELEKAYELGNSTAGLLLADASLSLANDNEQMKQARDIYQQVADKGDKEGQLKLAFMLEKGLGGNVDVLEAEKWYNEAATQGQVVAQYLLGHLYQMGTLGSEPDYTLAKKWYSSAQNSYAPAAVALGFIYDTVDDDYHHAFASYKLAVDQKDPIAKFDLGLIYEQGKGYPVNFDKAKVQYQEAADLGHRASMVRLANLYFNGLSGQRDEQQALEWYKKAAALGDRNALYQLGLLSETGVAMEFNFSDALRYYEQASEKGNAKASLALARIYQFGLGVVQDKQKAMGYYKALAQLGNAYAQYQLAIFNYEGIDGKRSPADGKKLLIQAKENGSLQASRTLQWLEAQVQDRTSFIEPVLINPLPVTAEQPAALMYLNALNDWDRGDEHSSRVTLDRLMSQFPDYTPAKRAYEQLHQQLPSLGIV